MKAAIKPSVITAVFLFGVALLGFGVAVAPEQVFGGFREAYQYRSGMGSVMRLLNHRAALGFGAGFVLVLLGFAAIAFRQKVDEWWLRWSRVADDVGQSSRLEKASRDPWQRLHPLVLAVCAAGIIFHLPTLTQAGFLSDDFEFFRNNQLFGLLDILLRPHGDHVMPLYRLEVAVLSWLSGTNPLGWNMALLALYALSLLAIATVLRQLKVHPVASAVAVALFAFGRSTSSVLAGYYCLSAQLQPITFALCALAAYGYGAQTRRGGYDFLGHVLLLLSTMADISGLWVLGGIPLLFAAVHLDNFSRAALLSFWRAHRSRVIGWIVVGGFAVGFYAYILGVVHPDTFLNCREMRGKPMGILGTAGQVINYLGSGVAMQMLLPIPERLPAYFSQIVLAISVLALVAAWRGSDSRLRWTGLALLALILLQAVEVAIARPQADRSFVVQLVVAAHVLATLLLAIVAHSLWRACREQPVAPAFWSAFALAGAPIMVLMMAISMAAYASKLFATQAVRQDLKTLGALFENVLPPNGPVRNVPTLDARYIEAYFPRPATERTLAMYDLSFYQDFLPLARSGVRLFKTSHVPAWTSLDVRPVEDLRKTVGEEFMSALQENPGLRVLYAAGVPLNDLSPTNEIHWAWKPVLAGQPSGHAMRQVGRPDEGLFDVSAGAEWILVGDVVDGTGKSLLYADIAKIDAPKSVRMFVQFEGDLGLAVNSCSWTLDPAAEGLRVFDLRQLPIYCLQRTVRRVVVRFETPGTYRIRSLALGEPTPAKAATDRR